MILHGNCLDKLKELPDESVDCVVTSPPYWALRDYGTAKWEGGEDNCDHKPDFKPRSTRPNTSGCGIGKSGYAGQEPAYKEICGKCGAKRVDKQLGLEPTFQEYISTLCDIFDEVKRVLKKEGTCWVNLGDTYSATRWTNSSGTSFMAKNNKNDIYGQVIEKKTGMQDKCLVQIPSRFAIEMVDRGWILRNEIIWHKPNCMPSSVKDRFTVDFEKVFFFVKNKKYWFETQYEDATYTDNRKDKGTITYDNRNTKYGVSVTDKRNKRAVWKIATKPFKEAHFATYPEALIEPMIKAGCPVGGTVLDPFFGAGTTGLVAMKQGKKYIGLELNPEYIRIAEKRLAQEVLL